MKETLTFEITSGGLGTMISFLSMVMTTGKHVVLRTNRTSVMELKQIFMIPDEQLTIIPMEPETDPPPPTTSDISKLLSHYYHAEEIQVLGQKFLVPNRTGGKKLVALACYQQPEHIANFNDQDETWPNYRYYSLDDYNRLIKYIKQLGYDVITLDSRHMSLEQKVYIMNEMCHCLIGYEGGMHHLAHLLKLPCIMLPWRRFSGHPLNPKFKKNETHFYEHLLHVDKRTYFAKSIDEIVNWSLDDFKEIITSLKNGRGNNVLLQDDAKPGLANPIMITNDLSTLAVTVGSQLIKQSLPLKGWEIAFIIHHYVHQNTNILGNPVSFVDPLLLSHVLH
jgi:hypothetical protein